MKTITSILLACLILFSGCSTEPKWETELQDSFNMYTLKLGKAHEKSSNTYVGKYKFYLIKYYGRGEYTLTMENNGLRGKLVLQEEANANIEDILNMVWIEHSPKHKHNHKYTFDVEFKNGLMKKAIPHGDPVREYAKWGLLPPATNSIFVRTSYDD